MHDSVLEYVGSWVEFLELEDKKVLDIGSYDVNGSTRQFFTGEYIGLDMRAGPGVDIVSGSWDIDLPDASFDVIVSTEMLEHDEYPAHTFDEIRRLLKPNGYVILTCRGPGYPLHEYPGDYHRFTPQDLNDWLEHVGIEVIDTHPDEEVPGAFAVGFLPVDAPLMGGYAPKLRGVV